MMARTKTSKNSDTDDTEPGFAAAPASTTQPSSPAPKRRNPLVYVAAALIVIVLIGIAYYELSGIFGAGPEQQPDIQQRIKR